MRHVILGAAVIGAAAIGALTTSTSHAAILSDLINSNGTIQVGDKLFSDFGYTAIGDMPDASGVTVVPQIDLDINENPTAWGIRFYGNFRDLPGNGASDALITYTVTVLDPSKAISEAHIYGDPTVVGSGFINIVETFLPENANAKIKLYNLVPGASQLQDTTSFLPNTYSFIHVQKDILADAGEWTFEPAAFLEVPQQAGVYMTYVDQTFSQVPEPATLGVLGLAATGLLFRRRKPA